ncbi:gp17 [Corynebacterium phage P1201]|uniref:Gp17 n=1 Tax=Corynebacterium phage P1201 TaxID=384848 RepID=A7IY88_9CAUD|nr:gp17 [Corynebacterium phage P1201]ABF57471.1 gp17 [Corynebacterium phage P1201]
MHKNFDEKRASASDPKADFNYGFSEGTLVIRISDVVRNACDIKPGGRVWGNAFHLKAKDLPGARIYKGTWVAPAKELAELVSSRGDLPKAEETLRALVHAIRMERIEGSEVWLKAQQDRLDEITAREREERESRMKALLESVLDWEEEE